MLAALQVETCLPSCVCHIQEPALGLCEACLVEHRLRECRSVMKISILTSRIPHKKKGFGGWLA